MQRYNTHSEHYCSARHIGSPHYVVNANLTRIDVSVELLFTWRYYYIDQIGAHDIILRFQPDSYIIAADKKVCRFKRIGGTMRNTVGEICT